MGKLFGTDGVRGVVNKDLTPELALKLGEAIGTFFGEDSRILVGGDIRAGREMVKYAVIAGLVSTGARVYDAGLTPTPALQYVVKSEGFDGGVVITASHNPPQYNGIKVIDSDGIEVSREKEREIEDIFFSNKIHRAPWKLLVDRVKPYPYVNELYVKAVVSHVDRELIRSRGFKVVVDPANSVGAITTPWVLRELGVKVVTINGNLDPGFPGREPEPTVETLETTARIVKEVGADFGVGHDGDADRAIFIDDKGRIWWGDRSAALLAKFIAEKHKDLPRRVYTAVSSSTLVEEVLNPLGIDVVWLPVGSVGISRKLVEEDGLCGFEENGGFMYPLHHPVRDGAMTTALMLQLLAEERRSLSELFDELPYYYSIKTKIYMSRDKALKAVEAVKQAYSGYRQVTIDGVKVFGEDFWFLVRPSGTEPLLRIMIEGKSKETIEKLLEDIKKTVLEAIGS